MHTSSDGFSVRVASVLYVGLRLVSEPFNAFLTHAVAWYRCQRSLNKGSSIKWSFAINHKTHV